MSDSPSNADVADAAQPTIDAPLDEISGRALVESWCVSGLSGVAFCRAHNLRPQRLHDWRERMGYPIKIIGDQRMTLPLSVCRWSYVIRTHR